MEQAVKLRELTETEQFIRLIHSSSKGYIVRGQKTKTGNNEKWSQWHYKLDELMEQNFSQVMDTYITINTMYTTYRRLDFVKELNALYIDLDVYKSAYSKAQALKILRQNHFNKTIPNPSMIVDSGRGLYLIWKIKKESYKRLDDWNALQKYFYEKLKGLGADAGALDAVRVLRVPGSRNSKNLATVSIVSSNDAVYSMDSLLQEFIPGIKIKPKEIEKKPAKKAAKKKDKLVFIHQDRSLYKSRAEDILKLCELRDYDMTGQREITLFLYRYYMCYVEGSEEALRACLRLNSMFTSPLKENELRSDTRSAERVYEDKDKHYKYTNEKLIEMLNISDDEEIHMSTIISEKEYKRRNNEYNKNKYHEQLKSQGKLTKNEEISQRRAKIKDLLAEGLKRKDICVQLNISIKTYKRDISYLKEQGII